jgi:hypothetical protein
MKFIHETLWEKFSAAYFKFTDCGARLDAFDLTSHCHFFLFFIPRWRKIDVAAGHVVQRNNCATDTEILFYLLFYFCCPNEMTFQMRTHSSRLSCRRRSYYY